MRSSTRRGCAWRAPTTDAALCQAPSLPTVPRRPRRPSRHPRATISRLGSPPRRSARSDDPPVGLLGTQS
jgi:hypothetical protein